MTAAGTGHPRSGCPACPICGSERVPAFTALVLERHPAEYLKCWHCGFLAIESPSWLSEAYQSPIAYVDTGILQRAAFLRPRLASLLGLVFPKDSVFADVGAGYGVLVRMMRDAGLDFRWDDPMCPNLLARGFELGPERCAAVTAVEVLEHTEDPVAFLSETRERTGASLVAFTTELLPTPVPDPTWWYYARPSGQHISFFERRTLDAVARRLGLKLLSRHSLHVLHEGQVARWQFLLAASKLSAITAAVLGRSLTSRTAADSTLFEQRSCG